MADFFQTLIKNIQKNANTTYNQNISNANQAVGEVQTTKDTTAHDNLIKVAEKINESAGKTGKSELVYDQDKLDMVNKALETETDPTQIQYLNASKERLERNIKKDEESSLKTGEEIYNTSDLKEQNAFLNNYLSNGNNQGFSGAGVNLTGDQVNTILSNKVESNSEKIALSEERDNASNSHYGYVNAEGQLAENDEKISTINNSIQENENNFKEGKIDEATYQNTSAQLNEELNTALTAGGYEYKQGDDYYLAIKGTGQEQEYKYVDDMSHYDDGALERVSNELGATLADFSNMPNQALALSYSAITGKTESNFYNDAVEVQNTANQYRQYALTGATKMQQMGVEVVGSMMPQFVATAVAVAVTGGASIGMDAVALETTSNIVTGALGLQNGVNDAFTMLQKGYDAEEAIFHGVMYGTISYLTEKISAEGFIKMFTGNVGQGVMAGAIKDGVQRGLIARNISLSVLAKEVLEQGKNEALEELIEGVADDVADTLFNIVMFAEGNDKREGVELAGYDGDGFSTETFVDAWMQLGKEGLYAGLSAGLMGIDGAFKANIKTNAEYQYWRQVANGYEEMATSDKDIVVRETAQRAYASITNEMKGYKQNSEIMNAVTELTKNGEAIWDEEKIMNTLALANRYDIQNATTRNAQVYEIAEQRTELIKNALANRGLIDWNTDLKLGDDTMATAEYVSRMGSLVSKNVELVDVEFDKEGKFSKSTFSPQQYIGMTRAQEVRLAELQNKLQTASKGNIDIQYSNSVDANGFYTTTEDNGRSLIVLNPDVDENMALELVAMHEFVHSIEGTEEYNKMQDIIFPLATSQGDMLRADKFMEEIYDKDELENLRNNGNYYSEEIAELVSRKYFKEEGSKKFIDHMVKYNTSGAYKLLYTLQGIFGNNGDPSVEGYRMSKLQRELTSALSKMNVVYNPDGTSFMRSEFHKQVSNMKDDFENWSRQNDLIPLRDYAVDGKDYRNEWEKALNLKNVPSLVTRSALAMTQYDTYDKSTWKYNDGNHTTGGKEGPKVPIDFEIVKNTNVLYEHPYAVFKSLTRDHYYVLAFKATDTKGNPIIMALNDDTYKKINKKGEEYWPYHQYFLFDFENGIDTKQQYSGLANRGASIYGKSDLPNVTYSGVSGVANWLDKMEMLWSENGEEKTNVLHAVYGLQLSANGHTLVDKNIAPLFNKSQQYEILESIEKTSGKFKNVDEIRNLGEVLGTENIENNETKRELRRYVNTGKANVYFINGEGYENGSLAYLNRNDVIEKAGSVDNVKAYCGVSLSNLAFLNSNNAYVAKIDNDNKAFNFTESFKKSEKIKKLDVKTFGANIKKMMDSNFKGMKSYQNSMMESFTSSFDKTYPERWFGNKEATAFMNKFNDYSSQASKFNYVKELNGLTITEHAMKLADEIRDYFDGKKVQTLVDIPDNIIQKMAEMDYVGNLIPQEDFTDEEVNELIGKYVSTYYDGRAKGRRLDILIGPAGAGKSANFQNELVATYNSANNDDDLMKEFIDPGYKRYNGIATPYANASGDVLDLVKEYGFEEGYNMLIQGTGKTPSSLIKWIEVAKQNGYTDIFLWSAETTAPISISSAISRFIDVNNGRWTPLGFAYNIVGDNPAKTYEILKNYEGVIEGEQKFRYQFSGKPISTDKFTHSYQGGNFKLSGGNGTQETIGSGRTGNERFGLAIGSDSGRNVISNIAPYREAHITDENYNKLIGDAVDFRKNAYDIASAMKIKIQKVDTCIGAFDGGNELSYQIETDSDDLLTNERYASLMADLGKEVQEAVITSKIVEEDSKEANANQIVLKVKDTDLAIQQLNSIGLNQSGYTVAIKDGEITINVYYENFETHEQKSDDEILSETIELIDNVENALSDNRVEGKNEVKQINSRYNTKADRRSIDETWLRELENGDRKGNDDNTRLKSKIKEAIRRIDESNKTGQVKFSKSNPIRNVGLENNQRFVEEYGALGQGVNPVRETNIASQNANGKVSQVTRTIAGSEYATDEQATQITENVGNGMYSHDVKHNEALMREAKTKLQSMGESKAYDYLTNWKDNLKVTDVDTAVAMGEELLGKYRDTDVKKYNDLVDILTSIGTMTGRGAQAYATFRTQPVESQVFTIKSEINRLQENINQRWGDRAPQLKVSDELIKNFINANESNDEQAITKALDDIATEIAGQVPSTLSEKVNAWRYMAMLTNPRTHVRNILSNTMFGQVTNLKSAIATGIEKATVKNGNRYYGVYNPNNEQDKAMYKQMKSEFNDVRESLNDSSYKYDLSELLTGEKSGFDLEQRVNDKRDIFGVKWLDAINKTNSSLLSKEDYVAESQVYARSMVGFLKARNISLDAYNAVVNNKNADETQKEIINEGRNWAYQQALRATFNDESALSNAINKFAKTNKATKLVVDSLVPFKRTPINLIKRGVEYSPLGLVKATVQSAQMLKDGKVTANEVIDSWASGLTGTLIAGLGFLLARKGIFRTDDDDNDRKQYFDEENGEQDYSLNFGDYSYTIDWADPIIMPLALGAQVANIGVGDLGDWLDVFANVVDPMFETTMLSNLDSTFKSYASTKTERALNVVEQMGANYVSQFFPTVGGQIARTIDGTRRTTYPNNGIVDKTVKTIKNKIPGLTYTNEPYVERSTGEEQQYEDLGMGAVGRLLLNTISPGYLSKKNTNKYTEESYRLYEETGNDDAFPSNTKTYVQSNGEKIEFTDSEYTQWNKNRYSIESDLTKQFMDSDSYDDYSDDEKVEMIGKIRDYAGLVAKKQLVESRGGEFAGKEATQLNNIQSALDSGLDLTEYYEFKNADGKKTDKVKELANSDLTTREKEYVYSNVYGYKGTYQDAYNSVFGKK